MKDAKDDVETSTDIAIQSRVEAMKRYQHFIEVKSVTIAAMVALQVLGILGAEFDASEADDFAANGDPPLCKEILDISMAQTETEKKEPDGIGNAIWRRPVTFTGVCRQITSCSAG